MTPTQLLIRELKKMDPMFRMPMTETPLYSPNQIAEAMENLSQIVIHQVGPDTPLGRIQRTMLKVLERSEWSPNREKGSKTSKQTTINAANGLVARGFAQCITDSEGTSVYQITSAGMQAVAEVKRREETKERQSAYMQDRVRERRAMR